MKDQNRNLGKYNFVAYLMQKFVNKIASHVCTKLKETGVGSKNHA
jgi:hypothetical protein